MAERAVDRDGQHQRIGDVETVISDEYDGAPARERRGEMLRSTDAMTMVDAEAVSDAEHHMIGPVPRIDASERDVVPGELWMRVADAHAIQSSNPRAAGSGFAPEHGMDFLSLLDRCVALEDGAGEIYRDLAERFAGDTELCALWKAMAEDERGHARKLATWRALVEAEAQDHRPSASGFEDGVAALEELEARARVTARNCSSPDEGFAIALALETSELDAIYTRLLQSSPIARFPDLAETARRETAGHHAPLIRIVRARSRDEQNLLRASLLATET